MDGSVMRGALAATAAATVTLAMLATQASASTRNVNFVGRWKVSNGQSQLGDLTGSDTFLQLPPRQRELILQALAGELPPDYAAQIQQYYLNISRGRPAVMPQPPPR